MTTFYVFTKPDCSICAKACSILDHLHIPYTKVSLAPESYDLTDPAQHDALTSAMSLAAWFDIDDSHFPLVVAADENDSVIARWTGKDIADPNSSWLIAVRLTMKGHDLEMGKIQVVQDEPPELPIGA